MNCYWAPWQVLIISCKEVVILAAHCIWFPSQHNHSLRDRFESVLCERTYCWWTQSWVMGRSEWKSEIRPPSLPLFLILYHLKSKHVAWTAFTKKFKHFWVLGMPKFITFPSECTITIHLSKGFIIQNQIFQLSVKILTVTVDTTQKHFRIWSKWPNISNRN